MVPIIAYVFTCGFIENRDEVQVLLQKSYLHKMFAKYVCLITTHYMLKAAKRKII